MRKRKTRKVPQNQLLITHFFTNSRPPATPVVDLVTPPSLPSVAAGTSSLLDSSVIDLVTPPSSPSVAAGTSSLSDSSDPDFEKKKYIKSPPKLPKKKRQSKQKWKPIGSSQSKVSSVTQQYLKSDHVVAIPTNQSRSNALPKKKLSLPLEVENQLPAPFGATPGSSSSKINTHHKTPPQVRYERKKAKHTNPYIPFGSGYFVERKLSFAEEIEIDKPPPLNDEHFPPLGTRKRKINADQLKNAVEEAKNSTPLIQPILPPAPKKMKIKPATVEELRIEKKPAAKPKKPIGTTTTFKRKRGVKPEDQTAQTNFTCVKMTLSRILINKEVNVDLIVNKGRIKDKNGKFKFQTIQSKETMTDYISALSIKATRIASLASLLLLAKVNEFVDDDDYVDFFNCDPKKVVSDCFYEVLAPDKPGLQRQNIDYTYHLERFYQLMNEENIQRPDNNGMGNTFKYLHQMYAVNFQNNIVMHSQRRLVQFFNTIPDVSPLHRKQTAQYLCFDPDNTIVPNELLLAALRGLYQNDHYNNYERGSLYDFLNGADWFKLVPLYIKIQRAVAQHNGISAESLSKLKARKKIISMAIVPICKYKRQHIRIDSESLHRILKHKKLLRDEKGNLIVNMTYIQFLTNESSWWAKYFDIVHINKIADKSKNKTRFHYQIQTDGVSASIMYSSKIPALVDNQKRLDRIRQNYHNGKYKYESSVDLGYNTYIAANRRDTVSGEEGIIKIKAKQFHRSTKNNIRKKKFKRLCGEYEKSRADYTNARGTPSPTSRDQYWDYIEHRLKFYEEGIRHYTQRSYAKMPFDKYTNTQNVIDKILHQLTNKSNCILFIGGAEFLPNSPIKGHVRCPGVRKIVKAAKKYANVDVVFVDEFNTSQHCGKCVQPFDRTTRNHRFKKCVNCLPLPQLRPAEVIITRKAKRQLQREKQLSIQNGDGDGLVTKINTINVANNNSSGHTIWHRDISAARLIWYKGVTALTNGIIHQNLVRNAANQADQYDVSPTTIIW